jgi:hypothetical protein
MDGAGPDDDALLAELADAIRTEQQVPEAFRLAGRAAYAHFGLDSELARLLADSADSATAPADLATSGMRSGAAVLRTLTFASSTLTIEVELHRDAVRGQVAPALDGTVELRAAELSDSFPIEDGWFVVRPLPAGPFRLSLRTETGLAALTDWITA